MEVILPINPGLEHGPEKIPDLNLIGAQDVGGFTVVSVAHKRDCQTGTAVVQTRLDSTCDVVQMAL